MQSRRLFLALTALAALPALPQKSEPGSQPGRLPRIGLLWLSGESSRAQLQALHAGLRAKGYIDGANIRIDDRFLVDRLERLPDAAGKLARDGVDVIFAVGRGAATAAVNATKTTPIVFVSGQDPVKFGVVSSLSRPANNATGISGLSLDLTGKRLQILRQAIPRVHRVGLLVNSAQFQAPTIREYKAVADAAGLAIEPIEVPGPGDIERVISKLQRSGLDALTILGVFFLANQKRLVAAVANARLPGIYSDRSYVEAGGLMSVGPSMQDNIRRAVIYIDKILKGAKPADLAVEQSDTFELAVNLGAAKALGIDIPQEVILQADRVIRTD